MGCTGPVVPVGPAKVGGGGVVAGGPLGPLVGGGWVNVGGVAERMAGDACHKQWLLVSQRPILKMLCIPCYLP